LGPTGTNIISYERIHRTKIKPQPSPEKPDHDIGHVEMLEMEEAQEDVQRTGARSVYGSDNIPGERDEMAERF
jgi:hypothetical protein